MFQTIPRKVKGIKTNRSRVLSYDETDVKEMSEEEKKAAEDAAKAAEEAAKGGAGAVLEKTPLEKLEEENHKLAEDRDNYKAVALKRLGKLPGDADFLDKDGNGLTVAEQVRLELLNREIDATEKAKAEEVKRLERENSELKLALKNRPGGSIGGEGGTIVEVKDNVFSAEQLDALRKKAIALKADPEKFIERAKANLANLRK